MGKVYRVIVILLAVAVACSAVATLAFAVWMCFSDFVNFWGLEHNVVYSVIKLLSGGSLYSDPVKPPFDVTQYSPLFYLLTAGVAAVLGIDAQSVHQVSVVARGTSILCAIALCAAIYLFATRVGAAARSIAALCTATFLVLESQWLFLALPNTLESLCMFLAVALAATSLRRGSLGDGSRWLLLITLSAMFGAAAFLAKQSGIQVVLIVGSFFVLKRQWAKLLCFVVVSFLAVTVFFVVTEPLLGSSLKENIIEGIRNPIALKAVFVTTFHPFFAQLGVLIAYAAVVTLDWFDGSPADDQKLLLWAMWGALAFALATGLKIGSSTHYFNDFIAILAPCAAIHLTRVVAESDRVSLGGRRLVVFLAVTFLCLLPVRTIFTLGRNATSLQVVNNTYSARTEVVDYIKGKLADRPASWFFAEDQVLALFLPKQGLFPHPDVMGFYPRREAALESYLKLVADGQVTYVVRSEAHKSTPWFIPKPEGFTLETVIGPYRVYRNDTRRGE